MGPYCTYCDQRCFTYITPEMWDIPQVQETYRKYHRNIEIIATCRAGQVAEKQTIGICYDDICALLKKPPTIVCLCGSTRFSEAFHEANLRETLTGKIVLSIGCDFKSDTDLLLAGELTQEDKERLDELHLRKIDLADEVLILNVNGYIGESTRRELAYAKAHDKVIRYLED